MEQMGDYWGYNRNIEQAMAVCRDTDRLLSIGFSLKEVNTLIEILESGRKPQVQYMLNLGIPYENARRIHYMYDIEQGKVNIETIDEISKHLKKMAGSGTKIGMADLTPSKIKSIPRKALIEGIKDATFAVYNSSQYPYYERMYNVVNISRTNVTIETSRKPVIKYRQPKFIEGVIAIKELKDDGKVVVSVNKKYCKLCNRFMIVASFKRPEFHHGMVEIVCIEGTKIYVYAKTIGPKDTIKYNMGTQRVYAYGFYGYEISSKLNLVAGEIYNKLKGQYSESYSGNQDYIAIAEEDSDVIEDDEIIIED